MALASTSIKNDVCTAYAAACTHITGHTAAPGSTGASEAAITRAANTWGSPSGGSVAGTSGNLVVTAGISLTHLGYYNALTTGTYKDSAAFTFNSQPFNVTLVVTSTFTAS
jgi:hypothetical protein